MQTPIKLAGAVSLLTLPLLMGCGPSAPPAEAVSTVPPETLEEAAATAFTLNRGVNLTSWFQDAGPGNKRFGELADIRALGADFIRLLVDPKRLYDASSPDWPYLSRTLDEARRVGLKVIVDVHPDFVTQREALLGDAQYPALLTKLAATLPKWGVKRVALELMNEPISPVGDDCDPAFDWNSWQQKFYSAARQGSQKLTLILTGACYSGSEALLSVKPINDARVIYTVHDYAPFLFTNQGASWTGYQSAAARNMPYPATSDRVAAITPDVLYRLPTVRLREEMRGALEAYGQSGFNRASMRATLKKASDWAARNKTRVFLGEYGVLYPAAPPQDRVAWIRDMRQTAEELDMAQALFDYNPSGLYGPFRGGKLERGVIEAIGLRAPATAIATPPNVPPSRTYAVNPVAAQSLMIADFTGGSQSNFGASTGYYSFGKPQQPTFTPPGPNGSAPVSGGHLQFDYSVPYGNEYAGVSAVVNTRPAGALETAGYTHLRVDLKATRDSEVRVELMNKAVDDGGDHPVFNVPVGETWETFTMPLDRFEQAGWGTPVDVAAVRRALSAVILTPSTTGASGTVSIDNIALVRVAEATEAAPLPAAGALTIQDFEAGSSATTDVFGYQKNDALEASSSQSKIPNGAGQALNVQFNLPAGNDWAGVLASTRLGVANAPTDLSAFAAVRIDLAASGTRTLRLELGAEGVETGGDRPSLRLTVGPGLQTYRIGLAEFQQAGWGTATDLSAYLRRATNVTVYADTVGTGGTFTLDNLVLERR